MDDNRVNMLITTQSETSGIEKATEKNNEYAESLDNIEKKADKTADKLNDFDKKMDKSADNTEKATKGMSEKTSSSFGNVIKGLGGAVAKIGIGATAIRKIGNVIIETSKITADYVETLNLLEVAYDGNTDSVREWTSAYSKILNLDESTLINSAAHFKVLSQSMGMATEEGEKFAKLMTQMTLDVSSLSNMGFSAAQKALQYATVGRGTTLEQKTGVSVLETTVQTTLDTLGVDAYVKDMNDTEKAIARVIAMTYQLKSSQGDLARTIEAPANQFRVLGEQISQLARNIGSVFLPIVAAILPYLNAILIVLNKIISSLARLIGFREDMWSGFGKTEDTASAFDDLADSVGGVGAAADSTNKKLQGLRGFDKLNNNTTPASTGGAGGGGAGGINQSLLDAFNKISGDYKSMLDGVETKATRISNAIMQWFDNLTGFGGALKNLQPQFDSIQKSAISIKKSLIEIFTDPKLLESAGQYVDLVKRLFSSLVINFVTIGVNLADGLLGGFAQFLESKKDDIVDDLTRMFDWKTAINNSLSDLADALGIISEVFTTDAFKGVAENVYSIFYEEFMNILNLADQFGADLLDVIITPISDNADKIRETFENTFKAIDSYLTPVKNAIINFFDNIWKTYDSTIKPGIENTKKTLSELVGFILDIWNKYVSPVLEKVGGRIGEIWEQYIEPIVSDIIGIIADLWLAWTKFYDQYLKPAIEWIIATIVPVLMPIVSQIANVVITEVKNIFAVIKSVIGVLKGVIDFLVGVFTGDWDKAWGGIQKIFDSVFSFFEDIIDNFQKFFKDTFDNVVSFFQGIVDSIKTRIEIVKNFFKDFGDKIASLVNGIKSKFGEMKNYISNIMNTIKNTISSIWNDIWNTIRGVINSILGGIEKMCNGIIRGLNKILTPLTKVGNKILSAVGIKSFSFSTLSEISIPRLEVGGLPDVGQMFIANEKGPELVGQIGGQSFVANQNQMMDLIDKKLSSSSGLQNATFVIQVGDETIVKKVLRDLNSMAKSNGKPITINGG